MSLANKIFFFAMFFPLQCFAAQVYNLPQLIDMALNTRPEMKIAQEKKVEADALIGIARSYYYPQVDLGVDYFHLDEKPYAVLPNTTINTNVDLRSVRHDYPALTAILPDSIDLPLTIPATKFDTGGQDLFRIKTELKQPLFTGGKIKERVKQSRLAFDLAKSSESRSSKEITFQVKSLYFQFAFAKRALQAINATRDRVGVVANFLQNLYLNYVPKEGGKSVTRADYLKAQLTLSKISYYASEATRLKEEALKGLKITCKLDTDDFSVSNDVEKFIPKLPTMNTAELKKIASVHRDEIRQVSLYKEISASGVKRAKANYYPDIGLFGYYQHLEDNFPNSDENVIAGGIGASIPIFNGMRTQKDIRRSQALYRSAVSQDELVKLKVSFDIDSLIEKLSDYSRKMNIEKKALSDAIERRKLEGESYLLDPTEYENYLDAFEDEIDAEVSLIKSKGEYYTTLAALQLACGL